MINLVKQDDLEFDRWVESNKQLSIALIAAIGLIKLRAHYKLVNVHYAAAIAARLGVEVAGLLIAEQIDGQSGVQAWQRYSTRLFSMDDMGLIPNPIAFIDLMGESEKMIRDHYGIDELVVQGIRTYNPATLSGRGNIIKTSFSVAKGVVDRGITKLGFYTR